MARIGILTFHRSYNYGAFVQSYALSHRLQKDFPDDEIEVIDYATARMYENYATKPIPFILGPKSKRNGPVRCLKNLCKLILDPALLKREKQLHDAFDLDAQYLPLSDLHLVTNDYPQLHRAIRDNYDIVIVGSDAVWEYKTYPFPNAYFLHGDLGKAKLFSYAASSGRMLPGEITKEQKEYMQDAFSRYSYLGIRDVATEKFLEHITEQTHYFHNCDPTVLLQLDTLPKGLDRIKAILQQRGIDLNKPIIGVMGGSILCRLVRQMFGSKYQIVDLYHYTRHADCYLEDLSPLEWAQVFSLFSVTVTRFFHGSLLSLKNGTPTIATDYWHMVDEEHPTKIYDLYRRLDLMDHYFYMEEGISPEQLQRMRDQIEYYIENPDSDAILQALAKEEESYQSFRSALQAQLGRSCV